MVAKFTFWKSLPSVLFSPSESLVMWFQLSLDLYKNLLSVPERELLLISGQGTK